MPSYSFSSTTLLLSLAFVLLLARPVHAFGAGNIASVAKIEGSNWRHGDIEDTLLTLLMSRAAGGKKFDKMSVARVYFGNWLRDYSQAIDVGTVKYVSAEAIRILLWVLGFMTFGFGTKEFEVTTERLGCYRPEDHIDNPKDYADNIDATQYDRRLRGPVDERVELAIDPQTGLKNYIANERAGIMTSALHVRKLFTQCIHLGRSYNRSQNKDELYEALRLLGTGLHCLEDYSAHSNYTELALIEMGERDIFPHVGRRTKIRLQGARTEVYPIVTGTFGGVDFLHSVMGEVSDKATQSEIQELEGTIQDQANGDTSLLQDLLNKIPKGIFGGNDEASKADELKTNATAAQMNQVRVSPLEPEGFTIQMQEIAKEIKPIMAWHDEIMLSITEAIEKVPVLPELIEQLEGQVNVFVFSLIAPFVLPIISQIKNELNTGSSEIIQSSKDKQLIVFNDDESSDPTHSMLSKDHFSNVLNEPAGKIASQVLKWVVPQIIQCMDDERADVDRTVNRIISGVFHHPAQRDFGQDGASDGRRQMFQVVEHWWTSMSGRAQDELRGQLSRQGVLNGENHKPGVEDTGHGCCKPLGMAKSSGGGKGGNNAIAAGLMGGLQSALGGKKHSGGHGGSSGGYEKQANQSINSFASEAAGGGALGGLVGALAGGVGSSLLSGAFGGDGDEKPQTKKYSQQGYNSSGEYQHKTTEYGRAGDNYAQAEYTQTQRPDGGRQTEYQRYEQDEQGHGSRFEQRREERPGYGGGFEQTERQDYNVPGGFGGGGYQEPGQEYGGGRGGYGGPPRQEYGGGGGFSGQGFSEPPRQEFGGGYEYGQQQPYGGERRERRGSNSSNEGRRKRSGSHERKKHGGHKKERSRSRERKYKNKSDDGDSDDEKKHRRKRSKSRGSNERRKRSNSRGSDEGRRRWIMGDRTGGDLASFLKGNLGGQMAVETVSRSLYVWFSSMGYMAKQKVLSHSLLTPSA
ncbi:heterokaryon incompatibility protein Het-C [Drepanopeziza brunnea f. sp. 'multigermtubi' MB_m1]|uniref:Heterokaryon incompatibility protein Het-C n=1 Tax=Marssonina brunnea f. sp. multigermtubi (strain MB_m1) TaxID=1072389 RepID=K1X008_MARBU|nr:heterokaryon incompatibility protein Het-C [Drepanopeziza brunnea f. sp. 'multigermtubi' MB_m1]EKD18551.1 heterokaryon incompatibility protein Het-C [Drepanopeziza brunnea f. sp. 'multigermtubi' MB_m1]